MGFSSGDESQNVKARAEFVNGILNRFLWLKLEWTFNFLSGNGNYVPGCRPVNPDIQGR